MAKGKKFIHARKMASDIVPTELVKQRLLGVEHVKACAKLQVPEKKLSDILYERGVNDKTFAVIRSKGDQALSA